MCRAVENSLSAAVKTIIIHNAVQVHGLLNETDYGQSKLLQSWMKFF